MIDIKVLVTPKGEYSKSKVYDALDMVFFNNDSWVAKKVSMGVTPTEGEYWFRYSDTSGLAKKKVATGTEAGLVKSGEEVKVRADGTMYSEFHVGNLTNEMIDEICGEFGTSDETDYELYPLSNDEIDAICK